MDAFTTTCSILGLISILLIICYLILCDYELLYTKLFVRSKIKTAVITEYRIYFKNSFFYDMSYDIEEETWLIGDIKNSKEFWIDYFKTTKKTTYATILIEKDFVRATMIVKKYLDN